jgi:heterodisulfide reductase subunit A-like polyferredoxin
LEDIEVKIEDLISDADGNYAYLTFGGHLYTPYFLETIDKDTCQNCERCLQMCDTRGIDDDGNVVPMFPEICSGCGHCVNACPSQSIKARPIPLQEMIERVKARLKEE